MMGRMVLVLDEKRDIHGDEFRRSESWCVSGCRDGGTIGTGRQL